MSEPIETTITIAVPDWYGTRPIEDDQLRQVTEFLDGEVFGYTEPGGAPAAGKIWQCQGDIHYGISTEVQSRLATLVELGIEFDAHADEYCEWPAEQWAWRTGWPKSRAWTSSPDADGMLTESEYRAIRKRHLEETYPADYLGFVEELDAFWPPALLGDPDDTVSAVA